MVSSELTIIYILYHSLHHCFISLYSHCIHPGKKINIISGYTVRIGYSVTASNDLSVIAMKSLIIKSKTLPHHTNCIGYSDLGYSDKPGITIGRREANRTKDDRL